MASNRKEVLVFCELEGASILERQFIHGDHGIIHHLKRSGVKVLNFSSELTEPSNSNIKAKTGRIPIVRNAPNVRAASRRYEELHLSHEQLLQCLQQSALNVFLFGEETLWLGVLLQIMRQHNYRRVFFDLKGDTEKTCSLRKSLTKEEEAHLYILDQETLVATEILHLLG